MIIEQFILGEYQTNSYVLRKDSSSKDAVIIDTGLDFAPLLSFLDENNIIPSALILTHGHIDHIKGCSDLRSKYPNIEVYIHNDDAEMLTRSEKNLSILTGSPFTASKHDHLLNDSDTIDIAGIALEVFHTPGHTQGGICLYSAQDKVLFSGDTLFADSVGRTDFPGGSMKKLVNAIKTKLLTLPAETLVYPGHGPSTTIAQEKSYNQYLI